MNMTSIRIITKIIFIFSLIGFSAMLFLKPSLPSVNSILPELISHEPIQTPIQMDPFIWEVKGQKYQIAPLYNYEIMGLIVSEYDSEDMLDISHKNDPAQTKDICLVWGKNLQNGIYRKVSFEHGEVFCLVRWSSIEGASFDLTKFSNNHLIPTNEHLKNIIKNAHIGDQIEIKGQLVNYAIIDNDGQTIETRNTSSVRNDEGCEVIFVSDFKILKKSAYPFFFIKNILGILMVLSGILNLIFFFFSPLKKPVN
jgi:hypothetical protein